MCVPDVKCGNGFQPVSCVPPVSNRWRVGDMGATSGQVCYATEDILLVDGWTARVLTECTSAAGEAVPLPAVEEWREALSRWLSEPRQHEVLKTSPNGQVVRGWIQLGDRGWSIIGKQSRIPTGFRGWFTRWRPSREQRNWRRGFLLLQCGVNTPLPLALLERSEVGCVPRPARRARERWLLTEALTDPSDLQQLALTVIPGLTSREARRLKDKITDRVVELFVRLHRHALHHRDLKGSNLLITGWRTPTDDPRVWLADLDGLLPSRGAGRKQWQPLMRLAVSLLPYTAVTRTDTLRFLRRYLAESGLTGEGWKEHWRRLSRQSRDYEQRSLRRKHDKLDGYLKS